MRILLYHEAADPAHWLAQIGRSGWAGGNYLHQLLADGDLAAVRGPEPRVLLLCEGEALCGFCTLTETDDIQPTELHPWIGFVFVFPEWRGRRLGGQLLTHAEAICRREGREAVYIATGHEGLYERYGYSFLCEAPCLSGGMERVYRKLLRGGGADA